MQSVFSSFGQPCIFLIGGPTKSTTPTALALHSGDVMIMGGVTRLSYHAVPSVLNDSTWMASGVEESITGPFKSFMELSNLKNNEGLGQINPNRNNESASPCGNFMKNIQVVKLVEEFNKKFMTEKIPNSSLENESFEMTVRFMLQNRVNLNARQVHNIDSINLL